MAYTQLFGSEINDKQAESFVGIESPPKRALIVASRKSSLNELDQGLACSATGSV